MPEEEIAPEEKDLEGAVGNLLATNLEEQGLQERDIAYDLDAMGESLDGQKFPKDPLEDVKDLASYSDAASEFVDDVMTDQSKLEKYLGEVNDLQKQIDDQRKVDRAAAEKVGIPLEDWYNKYGQDEFKRETESRTKLADANARFQESQLKYIDKLSGQSQKFLDGWDKVKEGMDDKKALDTIKDLRKLLGDAGVGEKSAFNKSLTELRDASDETRDLIKKGDKYQGRSPKVDDSKSSPYEESKLFKKLGIDDSKGALSQIDKQIEGLTGKDSAFQKLIDKLGEQEKRLQDAKSKRLASNPFLPPQ